MAVSIAGAVALVTGAGGGIGAAVARALSAQGVSVALIGRNAEKLQAAAVACPGETLVYPCDLLDGDVRAACVESVLARFGRLDFLINNAGVTHAAPFEETDFDTYRRVMDTNVTAPYFLTQAALPALLASKGAIVNVASVVAHKGYALQSAYAASKHALLGFSKSLAGELYERGVRVHVVSPGGVYTDMARIARPDLSPDGLIKPEDIAEIVTFLLTRPAYAVIDEVAVHRAGKLPFA